MIVIFTTPNCIYCTAAKSALSARGHEFTSVNVLENETNAGNFKLMMGDRPKTVPQIVINDELIGGYDQLIELIREDKLNELLEIEP